MPFLSLEPDWADCGDGRWESGSYRALSVSDIEFVVDHLIKLSNEGRAFSIVDEADPQLGQWNRAYRGLQASGVSKLAECAGFAGFQVLTPSYIRPYSLHWLQDSVVIPFLAKAQVMFDWSLIKKISTNWIQNRNVVELGCGAGRVAWALNDERPLITYKGFDAASEAIEVLTSWSNDNGLTFEGRTFDFFDSGTWPSFDDICDTTVLTYGALELAGSHGPLILDYTLSCRPTQVIMVEPSPPNAMHFPCARQNATLHTLVTIISEVYETRNWARELFGWVASKREAGAITQLFLGRLPFTSLHCPVFYVAVWSPA